MGTVSQLQVDNVWFRHALDQWLSISLTLQPFNRVPHVMETPSPNHKIIFATS